MNSRQLQNAILLSQTLNFSKAAAQLNITQPALSKQIFSLEDELGVELFDRSGTPLKLTSAGKTFIRDAKEMLFREEQLKRSMEEFKNDERGVLNIGVSPFRMVYLIPQIVKTLREKFPGLQIVLNEDNSAQLHKGAVDGLYDFAIVNLPVDETMLDVTLLSPERLVLAVPKQFINLIHLEKSVNSEPYPLVKLTDCKDLPFITLSSQQELRRLFDKLCVVSGLRPNIVSEVVGITSAWSMARAGVGATILPLQFLNNTMLEDDLTFFTIDHESTVRQPAVITRKGQYISKYAEYAINLLKNI